MAADIFAEVVVLSPVRGTQPGAPEPTFTYEVPPRLANQVAPGMLTVVPFGARQLYGIIGALPGVSPVEVTRPLQSLVDSEPVLTPAQLALARWISREYLAPFWRCLKLMLPPGLVGHSDVRVELDPNGAAASPRSPAEEQVLQVLDSRGPLRGRQLDRVLPRAQWQRAVARLSERGVVVKSAFLAAPRVRPKEIRTVQRAGADVDLDEVLTGLRSSCYRAVIEFLNAEDGPVDVSWVYASTSCTRYHLNKLAQRGLVEFNTEEVWRDPLDDHVFVPDTPPPLTTDQRAVWHTIESALQNTTAAVFLLQGVTGSGKTEIYLRAVAETLRLGRQAIVLVPEIGLTPQTAHRFGARFGRRIGIVHSALSDGQRYDVWRQSRSGEKEIVIGPRSALFAPFRNVGVIVVDEEHDASYKQEPMAFGNRGGGSYTGSQPLIPAYHARDTAVALARDVGATVILGSATPSLESCHRASLGEFTLLRMPRRIMGHAGRIADLQHTYSVPRTAFRSTAPETAQARYMPMPFVQVVDMRAELRTGNRSIFSRVLAESVDRAVSAREQVILFLNRRGTSTFILCRDCGCVLHCPHCNTPLTLHRSRAGIGCVGAARRLVCHHCGRREPVPDACPQCHGTHMRYFGLGTESVEQAVHDRWPDVRTLRWDSDSAHNQATHASIMHLFSSGLAQVLVGTQMVAKGLDLPKVTVVGVISADTALNLPDFRSAERTFQLVAQVAGRAGRGLLGGRVVVQTYNPDHYAIAAAADHDFERFASEELERRHQLDYPPFQRLAKLEYRDLSDRQARSEASALARQLRTELARRRLPKNRLIGPVPAFFSRIGGLYRWQVLLRDPNPAAILRGIALPPGWSLDIDPVSVL